MRVLFFIAALNAMLVFQSAGPSSARCLVGSADDDRRYGPLVTLTAERPPNSADIKRADGIVATVQSVLNYYRRTGTAQASGYEVAHRIELVGYTEVPRDLGDRRWPAAYDLHFPAALFYTRSLNRKSIAVLVGALYTAESDTTGESLDELIPLSIARWARIHPRCAMPAPDLWSLEVYPFEKVPGRIWRTPN
jgi:hypothetical protein